MFDVAKPVCIVAKIAYGSRINQGQRGLRFRRAI
jgi:hypothetical protein